MRQIITFLFFTTLSFSLSAQETFKKKYKVPGWITFSKTDTLFLVKDTTYKFMDLPDSVRKTTTDRLSLGTKITIDKDVVIDGVKSKISYEKVIDEEFYNSLTQSLPKKVDLKKTPFAGFVKFEENKVTVNPHMKKDEQGKFGERDIYYFKLKNRQTIRLRFSEVNISTLIIPIKYRFKRGNVPEDFTTAFNANLFLGYSMGKTSFFHRDKVDNKSNTWKITLGVIAGASVTELNASNTKFSTSPLAGDIKYNKGLASFGLGSTFSFNKINFGLFYGWDFAIGESAEKWHYNKQPWLGIAFGYSIFNFN